MEKLYDLIIIGAGSAGLSVAAGAAAFGAKTALIERGAMGGECLNTGCVPSKAFLRSAHLAGEIRNAGLYGLKAAPVEADLEKIMGRVGGIIKKIAPHDSKERFEGLGVDVFKEGAELLDKNTVRAGDKVLKGSYIVIATGALPLIPDLPGLESVPYYTNLNIFTLTKLPAHLLILGGGPVGLELGQAFRQLGSAVTVLERGPRLFPKDDPEVAEVMGAVLKRDGLQILTSAKALEVNKEKDSITITVELGGKTVTLAGDCLLVAAGRAPATAGLNLAAVGLSTDSRGYVAVDERLRTNVKNIYACGDITGQLQFTHMASYQAGIIVRNVILGLPARADYASAAWTTFTSPEVAHAGYTEARARELGLFAEAVTVQFKDTDRAIVDGEEEGFLKLVLGKGSRLIGATMVGRNAGETIPLASLAIKQRLKARAFAGLVFPYPTRAEIFKSASAVVLRRSLKGWIKTLVKKLLLN